VEDNNLPERRRHLASACFRLILPFLGLLAVPVCARPGGVDTSDWRCQLCAPSNGWEVNAEAGTGYITDKEFYFGDYTGLDGDGLYLSGDLFARYWSRHGDQLRLDGYRLGQDSRAVAIKGGRQGLYTLRASYQEIPVRQYDTTVTPYRGNGSDQLTLPAGWVRAPATQGMTRLDADLQGVDIKQNWDIYTAGLTLTPTRHWTYDVDYRRTERNGQDIYAGSFFFNTAEFTRPIDYQTDEVEAKLAYSGQDWQLGLGYNGSYFDDANKSLTWANAYSPQSPGQDSGQLALPPDNQAHQFTLNGSVRLPANTMVNALVSLGRMTQDDNLLPYTTNAQIVTAPLPGNSADGKVDTTNIDLRATSSPVRKFTVDGQFRYMERNNKTPERTYDYVVTDLAPSPTPVTNIAYDYDRYEYKLGGEYRIDSRTRVHAGFEHEDFKRSQQERDDTRTDRVSTKLSLRPIEILDMNVEIYTERRNGSDYDPITNVPNPQNPLMRLYNMADRDRNGVKSYLSVLASERVSFGVDFEANKDRYNNSPVGLTESTYAGVGLDISYLIARDISTYATTHWEQSKSDQANSQNFSSPDWTGDTNDKFFTGTLGLKYPGIIGKLGANLEYTYAKSTGEIGNDTGGLESSFPTLETRFHQVKLGLDYPYSKALSLKLGYLFQKYNSNDWALNGVSPDTVPNLLSLGADSQHYSNNVFFVGVKYLFDSRGSVAPSDQKPNAPM
jgi:MtrB/PioB family decaheme-associated outer membrane protein